MNNKLAWVGAGVGAILILALGFQTLMRYQYIQQSYRITRIDRLTGSSCELPCTPAPPTPTPTPFDMERALRAYDAAYSEQTQAAIDAAQNSIEAASAIGSSPDFVWSNDVTHNPTLKIRQREARDMVAKNSLSMQDALKETAVRLVCYCGADSGYRWEVNTGTERVSYVDNNADLMKKYGLQVKAATSNQSGWVPVTPSPGAQDQGMRFGHLPVSPSPGTIRLGPLPVTPRPGARVLNHPPPGWDKGMQLGPAPTSTPT